MFVCSFYLFPFIIVSCSGWYLVMRFFPGCDADKLGNVNEHVLANYLKNEYPQTIAVILSKIKAEHAAKVVALLPENFAMEIIMRMLRMDSVQKEVLDGLEKTLRKEFMSNLSKSTRRDSHELIAEIFNSLDRNTEGRFMEALEESYSAQTGHILRNDISKKWFISDKNKTIINSAFK